MTGDAPVPVPPPRPQVMKTISAPCRWSLDFIHVFEGRFLADLRIGARPEAPGELLSYLDFDRRLAHGQRLHIRVDGDKLDTLNIRFHHVVEGVAAAAAHADDFQFC